ncbi:NADPH dehydrogenase NamA [Brevibacillus fluminis]|uniref:NADPH dehydrogenase NamA n=1 Tax=Brevibacillus fluminis TaxID=511487 RepID=A0A3M8CZC8_9BACL|nr:NADPH dehydrogenase NamA [Brevibacillus fluminis]RNB81154.1 NADPH dehydrogenase NamA [Brevibacillus fluminis]
MSKLFSPITLGSLTLKNRIVMSPMCQYSADEEGFVTDWHPVHYVSRAVGGVGAIVVEASAVEPDGRISSHDLGIWQDAHVAKLAQIVKQVHQHDVKIGIQLAHAGRKSESAKAPVSSSDIAFSEKYAQPRALSIPELQVIVDKFREAGERVAQAGFDFIEIHAAHGYLINQFLSPLVNNRSDEYGGSMENRFRFLREIVLAVRERWSGRLFVRLSAEEYADGGNHIEEYVVFSKWLKELGVTLVDASSGAVVPFRIRDFPGYQVPLAERIRKEAGIATGAVGKITTPELAEAIVSLEQADLVFLGRELLRNPYWPLHAAKTLRTEQPISVQYARAFT